LLVDRVAVCAAGELIRSARREEGILVEVRQAILRAVPVFQANPKESGWSIRDKLVAAGIPAGLATDLIEFLPLAMSRAVLTGMGVGLKDCYIRMMPSGETMPDKKLLDEPVFREGLAAAAEVMRTNMAGFQSVLLCSSEFRAVNKALHAGSRPENLDQAPLLLLTREDDPRFFASTQQG
jgi:hypothetical protein